MDKIILPLKKKNKIAIGLMSGTSLDSIDAVLVEIKNSGIKTRIKQLDFINYPFPNGLKEVLLNNSIPGSGNVTDICRLNFLVAYLYSDAVKILLEKNNLSSADIDFIGSHGQTIHHLPAKEHFFNYNFGSTLQIGDPSVIAKKTGILTVGDFRSADVALNGEGAPLIPYFDYVLFHSDNKDVALLNIGGISNITWLKKGAPTKETIAFDTGPGNMMIDLAAKMYFDVNYDKDGKIAAAGVTEKSILDKLIYNDDFINRKPPKSTGREYYGAGFLQKALYGSNDIKKENILAAITEFTAYAVYRNFEQHINTLPGELIVSGGGAENKFLMKKLSDYFGGGTKIKKFSLGGITTDSKEAACFAFLANETLALNPSNLPSVTGASGPTILGKICLP